MPVRTKVHGGTKMNARIYANSEYVASEDVKQTGKYLLVEAEGTEAIELTVWNEKSKANDKHPDGKPWIKLPKGNITNRTYVSEDLFASTVNEEGFIEVETKTSAPRILGATGVKKSVTKYLDEATIAEYTGMVEGAVALFKEAKANSKRKKPEEMNAEELQEYIAALTEGRSVSATTGPKNFLDMFTEEEYTRYNEILALSLETKATAPRATRQPLTDEQKAARKEKARDTKISKAQALLAQLTGAE